MALSSRKQSFWLVVSLTIAIGALDGGTAAAQVPDADCFSGNCGGTKGIPECPRGYDEVGLVLYANSKANAAEDCETVVSCTNVGRRSVEINCRFYHGFNPVPAGGDRRDALCHAVTPNVAPGDTNECATDATADPLFQTGGIFLAGDANCPTFEGKGLVCVKGGSGEDVLCEAHLVCGNGAVLENLTIVNKQKSKKEEDSDSRD